MKLLAAISLFLLFTAQAVSCELSVRVVNLPPMYSQDEQGNWRGLGIDISQSLLRKMNCTARYLEIPWKRALHQMQQGSLDMMFSLTKTQERSSYMYLAGPLMEENMVLIVPRENAIKIDTFQDYQKFSKPIGLLRGGFYGDSFAQAIANDAQLKEKFIYANSSADNQNNLENRRISGFISQEYSAYHRLKALGNRYKVHQNIFYRNDVYVGLSKKSVPKARYIALQKALEQFAKNGELELLLSRYK